VNATSPEYDFKPENQWGFRRKGKAFGQWKKFNKMVVSHIGRYQNLKKGWKILT